MPGLGFRRSSCRYVARRGWCRPARRHPSSRSSSAAVRLSPHPRAASTWRLARDHKRVYRIYRAEGWLSDGESARGWPSVCAPCCRHQADRTSAGRWTSRSDTLASGRRFRTLNVVDDFTRECRRSRSTRRSEARVARARAPAGTRGRPAVIVCDNGPEFAGQTLDAWAYRRRAPPVHPTRQAHRELLHRELQRQVPRRAP